MTIRMGTNRSFRLNENICVMNADFKYQDKYYWSYYQVVYNRLYDNIDKNKTFAYRLYITPYERMPNLVRVAAKLLATVLNDDDVKSNNDD